MISEKMIEAFEASFSKHIDRKEAVKAGLTAALSAMDAEPVAHQWRTRIKGGAWDAWENGKYRQECPPFMEVEERPLFATPQASAMKVRDLEWEDHCGRLRSRSEIGTYWIEDNGPHWKNDRYWLTSELIQIHLRFSTLEEAQAAACADFARRAISTLLPDTGEVERPAAGEMIEIDGEKYRKFIRYPEEVTDGTLRCIRCGQIDEDGFHDDDICRAALEGHGHG